MILKLLGSIVVIAATTFAGAKKAEDLKEGYHQTRYLYRLLYMMESEIRYSHLHLEDVFSHLARQAQEPYKSWLLYLKREMAALEGGTFQTLWEQGVCGYLKRRGLPDKEIDRLLELGSQIGTVDLELQIQVLKGYQQQVSYQLEEMREHMKMNVRLCHCIGVMSGMLLAILLI